MRLLTIIGKDTNRSRRELWKAEIDDVAMEITRAAYIVCDLGSCKILGDDYEHAARSLELIFADRYDFVADEFHALLERRTFHHIAIFQEKTPLQMSEDQKQWEQLRNNNKEWRTDTEDIARRVAHMSVLDWRVWAGLIYLHGEEHEMLRKEDGEQAFPEAESRTMPEVCDETLVPNGRPLSGQISSNDEAIEDVT